jgi:hypothetical protein
MSDLAAFVRPLRITYAERVSIALGIHHAISMHRFILSSATCLAVPCFSTTSHKWMIFERKKS